MSPTTSQSLSGTLKTTQLADLLDLSIATIYRWLKSPAEGFPAPIRIGPRVIRWDREAVLRWLDSRQQSPGKEE
jgi:predicted DNA-binding transcriptional regulator AlpA